MRLTLLTLFRRLLWLAFAGVATASLAQGSSASPTLDSLSLFEQAQAYENGEGMQRDFLLAADLYCQAARLGNRDAQYNLGWMYANGRGVARHDGYAVFLFKAAADQGVDTAQRLLSRFDGVPPEMPDCMSARESPSAPVAPMLGTWTPVDYALSAPRPILTLVNKLAPGFQVEPQLALSIIAAESNFNARAVSSKNARGLMQLIPATSERFNVKNAFDPAQNIRGGLGYLRWLLAYFEGDVALVAAAYNSGERTVERYKGVPPYPETRKYVKRVLTSFGAHTHAFDGKVVPPSLALKK